MIPANALAATLQAYIKTPDLPLIQVVDAIQGIQQLFTVGEQVRATVTGQLPTGRFAVLVKDQMLDLNLPRNTEAGDELEMQVLANSPRLTFLLPRSPAANVGQAQPALPSPPDSSTDVELSKTAKFVGSLIAELAEQGEQPANANLLSRTAPLVASANALLEPVKLAEQLKQALTQGGLFYESHLAEWVEGGRTLAQILTEPPAKGFPGLGTDTESSQRTDTADSADDSRQVADKRAVPPALPDSLSDSEETLAQTGKEFLLHGKTGELELLPSAARQQVQQQLQLLDQRQIVWQGEAWPGQPLKWEVEEDDRRREQTEGAMQNRIWRTRLQLDLPNLGLIEAIITLHDQTQVEVGFVVSSAATASRIRTEQARLQTQMEAAGLALNGQQVIVSGEQEV